MSLKVKIFSARCGDKLFLYDAVSEPEIRKAIVPDGHAMIFSDGTSEWVIDEVVMNGPELVWDRSGNRVKHERCRYFRDASGKIERKSERFVYKSLD